MRKELKNIAEYKKPSNDGAGRLSDPAHGSKRIVVLELVHA
jgi:hypothetical protein